MREYNIIYKIEDEQLHNGERPFEEYKDTNNCYFHTNSIEEAKEACLEYLVDTYSQKDGIEDVEEVDGTVEVAYADGRKEYFSCHEIMARDEESGEDVSAWKQNCKRFDLKKFSIELKKKPDEENLVDILVEDEYPTLIKSFDSLEEAKKELEKYGKPTIRKFSNYGMTFYEIEGYGIECNVVDEDGEWVDGGDYIFNEESEEGPEKAKNPSKQKEEAEEYVLEIKDDAKKYNRTTSLRVRKGEFTI